MGALLDALGWAGESLDKPGAAMRGLLAGRPGELANLIPFSDTLGFTDPSQRTSGRGLLEQYSLLSPKQEGEAFGLGDLAGIGVEMLLDPTNLVGAGAIKKLIGVQRGVRAANANREMLLAKGAMPEEIAKLTKVIDEAGNPVATYHGTPHAYDKPDWSKMDPEGLYGPEYYSTESPELASEYSSKGAVTRYEQRPDLAQYLNEQSIELEAKLRDARRRKLSFPYGDRARYAAELEELDIFNEMSPITELRNTLIGTDEDKLTRLIQSRMVQSRPHLAGMFNEIPPAQNVRKQFLDFRNPFDVESRYPIQEADRILMEGPGTDRYFSSRPRAGQESSPFGGEIYKSLADELGSKEAANAALRQSGYDSIQHIGGMIGAPRHQVHIAFDPSQIYQPLVVGGPRKVPSMSPLLAALGAHNVGARY